jgi:hypothetical protein
LAKRGNLRGNFKKREKKAGQVGNFTDFTMFFVDFLLNVRYIISTIKSNADGSAY